MTEHQDTCRIWIGTSGFSYADWAPDFYPAGITREWMLPFYASCFDTVELNYTFYHLPQKTVSARMAQVTPEGFQFFVKMHQSITHLRRLDAAEAFLDGIVPLSYAGKLSGLLFQFPQSFKNTRENRGWVARTARAFQGYRMAVEFRDRSWAIQPVYRFLRERGMVLVAVDEPQISTLFPPLGVRTSNTAYVRFHSRNEAAWFGEGKDRYDYLYKEAELAQWLPLLDALGEGAGDLFVYFNNCRAAQAARNAREMRELVRRSRLQVREPSLRRRAQPQQGRLW